MALRMSSSASGRVADFAFAHAARARLAEADDVQRAVGINLADDGANL